MLDLPATDYLRAMRVRTLVKEALNRLFLDCDVLVSPSRMELPPKVKDPLDGGGGTPLFSAPRSRGLRALIPAGNLAGLPALSLPCGFASGLPVGISLVGRPLYENQLVGLGKAFQAQTDWHRRRPAEG
jgi:aspartyl-tRNA(Asn)/glutamyl-tRNA(Gln) amidotransferase subunit A